MFSIFFWKSGLCIIKALLKIVIIYSFIRDFFTKNDK